MTHHAPGDDHVQLTTERLNSRIASAVNSGGITCHPVIRDCRNHEDPALSSYSPAEPDTTASPQKEAPAVGGLMLMLCQGFASARFDTRLAAGSDDFQNCRICAALSIGRLSQIVRNGTAFRLQRPGERSDALAPRRPRASFRSAFPRSSHPGTAQDH